MEHPSSPLVDALAAALAARPEIQEAYLFGSVSRGEATAHSDVDVAVHVDHNREPATPFGYAADLSAYLGAAAGRRDIDVVVLNEAPPVLYHRVLASGRRLLSRDLRATTTREGLALSRYCDYIPQLQRIDEALRRRLRAGTFGR